MSFAWVLWQWKARIFVSTSSEVSMKAVSFSRWNPGKGGVPLGEDLLRDLELIQLEGRPGGAVAGVPRRIGGAVEGGQGHLAHDLVVRVARHPVGAEPHEDVGAHPPDQLDGALHQLLPGHVRQLPVEEPEEVDLRRSRGSPPPPSAPRRAPPRGVPGRSPGDRRPSRPPRGSPSPGAPPPPHGRTARSSRRCRTSRRRGGPTGTGSVSA